MYCCHFIEHICTYKSQYIHSHLRRTPYFSSLAKCLIHKIIILRRRGATYLPNYLYVVTTVYPRYMFALKHNYQIVKRVTASHGMQYNALRQIKHQLDVTLCRFYFCRVTLRVSGATAHHQEYLKLVRRPLVHVFCKNI